MKIILNSLILLILGNTSIASYGTTHQCLNYLSLNLAEIKMKMSLAKSQYEISEYETAIGTLREILTADRTNYSAFSLLSRSYYNLGQIENAFKAQKKALKFEPSYIESNHFHMAQILYTLGRFNEAETFIRSVLKLNPNHIRAFRLLAQIQLQTPDTYEAAFSTIESLGDLASNNANYLKLKAEYFYKRKDYRSALKASNRMISENKPKRSRDTTIHGLPTASFSYKIGLVIKAKVLLAMNIETQKALELILEFEQYVLYTKSWVTLLKAEAYFKLGLIKESKSTLLTFANQSNQVDLDILAAIVRLETEGERASTDLVVARIFQTLNQIEIHQVMSLSKENRWDYVLGTNNDDDYKIINTFWFGLNHRPIDSKASFSF